MVFFSSHVVLQSSEPCVDPGQYDRFWAEVRMRGATTTPTVPRRRERHPRSKPGTPTAHNLLPRPFFGELGFRPRPSLSPRGLPGESLEQLSKLVFLDVPAPVPVYPVQTCVRSPHDHRDEYNVACSTYSRTLSFMTPARAPKHTRRGDDATSFSSWWFQAKGFLWRKPRGEISCSSHTARFPTAMHRFLGQSCNDWYLFSVYR